MTRAENLAISGGEQGFSWCSARGGGLMGSGGDGEGVRFLLFFFSGGGAGKGDSSDGCLITGLITLKQKQSA